MSNDSKGSVLVVLSGGLDSAVAAYKLKNDGYDVRLLYIDYDKDSTLGEEAAAKLLALKLGAPIEIVDFSGFNRLQRGFVSKARIRADEADIKDLW